MSDTNGSDPSATSAPEGSTTVQERTEAFQLDMLQVDIDYARLWVETMAALVDERLDHDRFTEQRMSALHEWERKRKLAQARLRSRYNPKRRPAALIDATTREGKGQILENLRQWKLDMEAAGLKRPEWKKSKGRKLEEQLVRNAKAEIAAENDLPPKPVVPPTPAEAAAQYVELVAQQSGLSDVLTAPDSRIREGLRRKGATPEAINKVMQHFPDAVFVHTGQRRPLLDE